MSDSFLTSLQRQNAAVADLTRQERPAAALTLTRSATLAIVTTGTVITWQTQTRGQGITWSGTTITIPTAGYYLIQTLLGTSANVTMYSQLIINTVNVGYYAYTWTATTYHVGSIMRYFATGDTVQINVIPSANVNITQTTETVSNASPWLHITQLTSVVV